ncbi:MAG TPA: sodium:solute symporter family protein [Pyrinomonadaceae bacterium]|nr:sodium:solute symporter family protein [Pyrinomonadaceae bacterium]
MTSIYFWTIVAYMIFLVGVGAIRSRSVKDQEDFSVAGRQLSTFVLFGTMLATWIGTGSIFGNAGKTYEVGIAAWILPLGGLIGIICLSFLAAKARRLEAITVQDILEARYNKWARVLGVITLVLTAVTIVSYQYRAAAAVINLALPSLDFKTAVIIITIFIIIYTALAGMFSVAYTDLVMGITMIIGIFITLPYLYFRAGGYEGIAARLPPDHMEFFGPIGWVQAVGYILPAGLLILGDANMYQRFFSARTEGAARRATFWLLAGVAYMELMIIFTAWVGSALEWQGGMLRQPGRVIAYVARDYTPIWLGAIVLTTIMAVIVSTAISYLLVPATALVRDLYQRFINPRASERSLVWLLRGLVIGLGLIAYVISTYSERFLEVALRAYTIYGAGVTPSLVAALVWRRATAQGAIASISAGVITTLVWEFSGLGARTGVDPVIPAISLSVLALVLVSLFTAPPRREQLEPFYGTKKN